MPIEITIEENLKQAAQFVSVDSLKAIKKTVARSIRRTFTGVRTESTKTIRTQRLVNTRSLPIGEIKKRYMREAVKVSPAMPLDAMRASLTFTEKKPSLHHFFAKRVITGTSARTGKSLKGARVTVMGKSYTTGRAFIPEGKSGPILARIGRPRLPLRKLFGPSFATMMSKTGLIKRLQTYAQVRFTQEFEANLRYYLSKGE